MLCQTVQLVKPLNAISQSQCKVQRKLPRYEHTETFNTSYTLNSMLMKPSQIFPHIFMTTTKILKYC